jgi:hypothetical protein
MKDKNRIIAEQLKQLLIDASPLIEEYTAIACPVCNDVCCRQKHGLYKEKDILYLQALGTDVPDRDRTRQVEGPCESMGQAGCAQPRWLRPFKCTWYFCDPLLVALQEGPQKKARKLSAMMQEMIELYGELKLPDCKR